MPDHLLESSSRHIFNCLFVCVCFFFFLMLLVELHLLSSLSHALFPVVHSRIQYSHKKKSITGIITLNLPLSPITVDCPPTPLVPLLLIVLRLCDISCLQLPLRIIFHVLFDPGFLYHGDLVNVNSPGLKFVVRNIQLPKRKRWNFLYLH